MTRETRLDGQRNTTGEKLKGKSRQTTGKALSVGRRNTTGETMKGPRIRQAKRRWMADRTRPARL
jgi:hypothetical protein